MWEIYIAPKPPQRAFSDAVIASAKRWWERHPTFVQTNGLIRLAKSFEERDAILAQGKREMMFGMIEWIKIETTLITLGFAAQRDTPSVRLLLDFAEWVHGQCEVEMFDDLQVSAEVNELRGQLGISLPE